MRVSRQLKRRVGASIASIKQASFLALALALAWRWPGSAAARDGARYFKCFRCRAALRGTAWRTSIVGVVAQAVGRNI
jgi:hypothetical protein